VRVVQQWQVGVCSLADDSKVMVLRDQLSRLAKEGCALNRRTALEAALDSRRTPGL